MRIIVYPHAMEVGGSQLNAIELAGAVRDLGHDVLLVSEHGALVDKVDKLGLEHLPIPMRRQRPSPTVANFLVKESRRRAVDVVHGHEWPPAVEAYLGPRLRLGTPAVGTVMSAAVAPFLPREMPLVVGTEQLRQEVVADGYRDVTLIEPPVDVEANSPSFDEGAFRAQHGLASDGLLVVVCCRLVKELKLEGLLAACDAIGAMARDGLPVQLAIVGDGDERDIVREQADRANAIALRRVVAMTGELADPRPAYAAADVILGMGGSALRGMAFGKPLVVQGERGFWRACTPETVGEFLRGGWYGLGDGTPGALALRRELEPLIASADVRSALGDFARSLVVERFSLLSAAKVQVKIYDRALEGPKRPVAHDLVRLAALLAQYKLRRRVERLSGRQAVDDFNALRVMRANQ